MFSVYTNVHKTMSKSTLGTLFCADKKYVFVCISRSHVHRHTSNINLGLFPVAQVCTITPHINFLFDFSCVEPLISNNTMSVFDLILNSRFIVWVKLIIKL